MIYLTYNQQELDAQYNQATLVSDISPYISYWNTAGETARATLDCQLDVPYGAADVEKLDIFPAADKNAPIHVHVHGGAWKQIGKEQVSYPAPHFVATGATYIALNFGLAPDYSLSAIVDQVRGAIKWIWQNAERPFTIVRKASSNKIIYNDKFFLKQNFSIDSSCLRSIQSITLD